MRVANEFILREIAGEYMLVPIGAAAVKFNGLITMNEVGHFIFTQLQQERTEEELLERIISEYDVDAEQAHADLLEFLQQMREVGALVEDK